MTTNRSTDLTTRLVKYVKTCFASPQNAGRRPPHDQEDPVAKEHILQEIRRTAEANGGRPLGRDRFLKETGIRQCDFLGRFWTRWNDAVREAGYTPNQFQVPYPDAFLLEKYAGLIRSLGRVPSAADLLMNIRSDKTFPHPKVFQRFGSKAALLAKVAEHCRSHDGLQDVAGLCERHLSSLRPSLTLDRTDPASARNTFGFVYLMTRRASRLTGTSALLGSARMASGLSSTPATSPPSGAANSCNRHLPWSGTNLTGNATQRDSIRLAGNYWSRVGMNETGPTCLTSGGA